MKKLLFSFAAAALLFTHLPAQAQPGLGGPGMKSSANAAMMKLFGKSTSFTSKAEMKVSQPGSDAITMSMTMAVSEGKMRSEMDMGTMKGMQLPPQALAQMKQLGMDKMVSVVRPDTEKMYIIYPNMKAYVEMAMPKEEAAAAKSEVKIDKEELGKETVDGHPTVKNKVVITDEQGQKHTMTVWNATDMKDFPIKMTMQEQGTEVEVLYTEVKLSKPEASLFEAPAGLEKFSNVQEMMMKKMMGGAGAP